MPPLVKSFRLAVALAMLVVPAVTGQAPSGLAASAIADARFHWVNRVQGQFRVHFLAKSYPAQHQDSLIASLAPAIVHAQKFINATPTTASFDVFFIESREQMTQLIGRRATGYAEPESRTVFLMTNASWRAFERHEIMHVVVGQSWGSPAAGTDWLSEGLAQAADGYCAGRSNAEVAQALAARHGWISLATMLSDFRNQPDLRAYLQAAAFVAYLHDRFGPAPLKLLWSRGATPGSVIAGHSLQDLEREWRGQLRSTWQPAATVVDGIEGKGCG